MKVENAKAIQGDGAGVTAEELAQARRYPMVFAWSDEDQLLLVSFPDVPGLRTHGATVDDAARRGAKVIALWVTAMRDASRPLPAPTLTTGQAHANLPDRYSVEHVRAARKRLGVSQRAFAELLNVSLSAVRSWEQGWRMPDGGSLRLLHLAERHPEIFSEEIAPGAHRAG